MDANEALPGRKRFEMCESIVEWVSWSEGVKWKKRGPVVDENWSIVECRNLEIAESDFVEYFEELR